MKAVLKMSPESAPMQGGILDNWELQFGEKLIPQVLKIKGFFKKQKSLAMASKAEQYLR